MGCSLGSAYSTKATGWDTFGPWWERDMGDVILSGILSGWMWMCFLLQNASFQTLVALSNPVYTPWVMGYLLYSCVGHPYKNSLCRRVFAQPLTADGEEKHHSEKVLCFCHVTTLWLVCWTCLRLGGASRGLGSQALVAMSAHSSAKWKGGTRILFLEVCKIAGSWHSTQTSLFWKTLAAFWFCFSFLVTLLFPHLVPYASECPVQFEF